MYCLFRCCHLSRPTNDTVFYINHVVSRIATVDPSRVSDSLQPSELWSSSGLLDLCRHFLPNIVFSLRKVNKLPGMLGVNHLAVTFRDRIHMEENIRSAKVLVCLALLQVKEARSQSFGCDIQTSMMLHDVSNHQRLRKTPRILPSIFYSFPAFKPTLPFFSCCAFSTSLRLKFGRHNGHATWHLKLISRWQLEAKNDT